MWLPEANSRAVLTKSFMDLDDLNGDGWSSFSKKRWYMTRKDSERDAERPRYYSQFWLDVAAGRRVIGTPKTDEGAEGIEPETPEASVTRRAGRNNSSAIDGYREAYSRTAVEPMPAPEEVIEPEADLEDELTDEVDELDIPNIVVEEASTPDAEAPSEAEEAPDEDFYDEDEDDDLDWSGRGRKKPKPGRQVKQPKKGPKRDPRRGY